MQGRRAGGDYSVALLASRDGSVFADPRRPVAPAVVFWLPLASGNCLGPAPCFGLPYAGEQSQLRLQRGSPCITRLVSTRCDYRAATHPMLLLTSCNGTGPAEAGCTSGSLLTATRIRRLVSIRMAFMLSRTTGSRPTLAGSSAPPLTSCGPAGTGCASGGLLTVARIGRLVQHSHGLHAISHCVQPTNAR